MTAAIAAFAALLRSLPGELAAIAAPPAPAQRMQPAITATTAAELGDEVEESGDDES